MITVYEFQANLADHEKIQGFDGVGFRLGSWKKKRKVKLDCSSCMSIHVTVHMSVIYTCVCIR